MEAVGFPANASVASPSHCQSWCVASKMSHFGCPQNVHPTNCPKYALSSDEISAQ
jgi:hypothetical protein